MQDTWVIWPDDRLNPHHGVVKSVGCPDESVDAKRSCGVFSDYVGNQYEKDMLIGLTVVLLSTLMEIS